MLGCTAVTDSFGCFGVDGTLPLFIPVKGTACVSHPVVNITGVRDMLCDVRSVGSDP